MRREKREREIVCVAKAQLRPDFCTSPPLSSPSLFLLERRKGTDLIILQTPSAPTSLSRAAAQRPQGSRLFFCITLHYNFRRPWLHNRTGRQFAASALFIQHVRRPPGCRRPPGVRRRLEKARERGGKGRRMRVKARESEKESGARLCEHEHVCVCVYVCGCVLVSLCAHLSVCLCLERGREARLL